MSRRLISVLAALGLSVGVLVEPAEAGHRAPWGHWKVAATPFTVRFIDSATNSWTNAINAAAADWSASDVLDVVVEPGSDGRKVRRRCPRARGAVRICNFGYGATGWVGLATFRTRGRHIVAAALKLNSTYLGRSSRKVVCHEMGHGLGLGHRSQPRSCMKQGSARARPDGHDFKMLQKIYRHTHSTGLMTTADHDDGGEKTRTFTVVYPAHARTRGR